MILDRLSEAPPETVLGINHYMHGEVCRRNAGLNGLPASPIGRHSHSYWLGLEGFGRGAASHALGRRSASAATALVRRTDLCQLPELCRQRHG